MPTEQLFLGVDGGGTHCRARLCSEAGVILGEGMAGPANVRLGVEESFAEILEASRQCLAAAGLSADHLRNVTACLALAGASEPTRLAAVEAYRHPFRRVVYTNDAHAACVGAHGGQDGGVVIAGTGTVGWAVIQGRHYRVGGWGFPISDEGSGAWLGCEAVRRVLWAYDGRIEWTDLLAMLFGQFRSDAHLIVQWMTTARPRDFARHARAVVAYAGHGDPVALELVRSGAAHLDALAARLVTVGAPRLAMLGGLAEPMRPWLAAETAARLVTPAGDALSGALRLARLAAEPASAAAA
jgi:glucosamine kinase